MEKNKDRKNRRILQNKVEGRDSAKADFTAIASDADKQRIYRVKYFNCRRSQFIVVNPWTARIGLILDLFPLSFQCIRTKVRRHQARVTSVATWPSFHEYFPSPLCRNSYNRSIFVQPLWICVYT